MGTRAGATLLTIAVLLAAPAAADAATTFGSRLLNDPANSGECTGLLTPCTIGAFIHPSNPNGDPYSGGAPVSGVITKFRTRIFGEGGAAATVTLKLVEISRPDPNNEDTAVARLVGTGPTVTIPANPAPETPILEFAARLPVAQGQQLALEGTNMWATYNNSGNQFSYIYAPPLVAGQGPRGNTDSKGELLVQADLEPDADGDGFGDETQDACPQTPAGQTAPCPPDADLVKPSLGSLSLRPKKFEAGEGTTIRFRLSEAAEMRFAVYRARPGRRVGGRCVKPKRSNANRRRCIRYVKLRGSLKDSGQAGQNSFRWNGRLRGRALAPGKYRLGGQARDGGGNLSKLVLRGFTVVKPG